MDVGEFRYTVKRHKKATRATRRREKRQELAKALGGF